MKNHFIHKRYLLLLGVLILTNLNRSVRAQNAQQILNRCVQEFGGEAKVKSIRYLKTSMLSHSHMLEQSERPQGPYIVVYEQGKEQIDLITPGFRKETNAKSIIYQSKQVEIFEKDLLVRKYGKRAFPMPKDFVQQARLSLWQNPLFILQQALQNAKNLRYVGNKTLQGVSNYHLQFTLNQTPINLYINQYTHLLTSVAFKTALPHGFFWSIWGKFNTQVYYSLYHLLEGGIRYPQQWDVFQHEMPYKTYTFTKVRLAKTITEEEKTQLKIPQAARDMAQKMPSRSALSLKIKPKGRFEINEGLFGWKHNWNVGVIIQEKGIYIIESPMTSGYSKLVIAKIKAQYPGKKIKGVICTSDAWPHIGGVRQYAAEGIPIFTQHLNKSIIQRILKADYSLNPDDLEKRSKKPRFQLIDKKISLKDPNNTVIIVPANGEGAERMLFLYFPRQKVLYTSDMVQYQKRKKSFFMPQYLSEVKRIVDKEGWKVNTIFGMHLTPMPWKTVVEALERINQSNK